MFQIILGRTGERLRSGEMEVEAEFDQLNKVLVVGTGLAGPRVEVG